ncbi:hypothetical protein BAOM_4751 [Peribacillus asahii]|uniref:PglD N-terminal domain-containing protein n=1 Tax=Peribacillus asahii TaxID=228899 RepID=A0A3Q9RRR1_9BACI|nr:acetyltransferase [Peribacillus asahii]AZV45329.1 hypothetical protein BAOM_4751 [Peribacillus asahii]
MKPIIVIGEGGHSKVIQDIISASGVYTIIAILDDKYTELFEKDGIKIGPISEFSKLESSEAIIAIGSNHIRKKIVERLECVTYATLIHPSAIISPSANIAEGTVVMAGSIINADTIIGKHAIINSLAVIEHDNNIRDYAHISPGAILTGNVQVGEGTHIGAGVTIIPGKNVGNWSIIGAGATVVQDIPNDVTAVGIPAKVLKHLN